MLEYMFLKSRKMRFNGGGTSDASCRRCYATGQVFGYGYVGGFVGNHETYISECYATGSVETDQGLAGGFVGYNGGEIRDAYARGSVRVVAPS